MRGIYTYISETNYVPREYSVAVILLLLFMVRISLVSVLNLLYFYITILNAELNAICYLLALLRAHHIFHVSGLRVNTFRSMCAVPNMAVFCNSLTSRFPGMFYYYYYYYHHHHHHHHHHLLYAGYLYLYS